MACLVAEAVYGGELHSGLSGGQMQELDVDFCHSAHSTHCSWLEHWRLP